MSSKPLTLATTTAEQTKSSTWRDWLGVCASIGCALHCAAMPLVISYLPALGLSFLADESFHKVMLSLCFAIAVYAFVPGFLKHRNWLPASFGAAGLIFVGFGAFAIADECCPPAPGKSSASSDCNAAQSCCDETCQSESLTDTAPEASKGPTDRLVAASDDYNPLSHLLPWVTPLGGLLLVGGHLLNRKYGCACDCCPPPPTK